MFLFDFRLLVPQALVGLPPHDLLEDLAVALREHGLDPDTTFEKSVACSNEFIFDPCRQVGAGGLKDKFAQKFQRDRTFAIKWKALPETLNPQPICFEVIHRLLAWIDRCDRASQQNLPRPSFECEDGSPIFPPEGAEDELWWLTDVKKTETTREDLEEGPPDTSEEEQEDAEEENKKPADALTSDSDPESGSDMEQPSQSSQTVILPVVDSQRKPFVAWRNS